MRLFVPKFVSKSRFEGQSYLMIDQLTTVYTWDYVMGVPYDTLTWEKSADYSSSVSTSVMGTRARAWLCYFCRGILWRNSLSWYYLPMSTYVGAYCCIRCSLGQMKQETFCEVASTTVLSSSISNCFSNLWVKSSQKDAKAKWTVGSSEEMAEPRLHPTCWLGSAM